MEVWASRERRVSCTPGAEGAEVSGETDVGWAAAGTKRRDMVCGFEILTQCGRLDILFDVCPHEILL